MNSTQRPGLSLLERLDRGPVICAEGYVFELERRGYLQAGAFVPEVVLDHPEVVKQLHRDFVHAGSDVVEALTYYAHREKLRVIGREQDLEPINRRALDIAKSVAIESGALFAGDVCNTNVYDPANPESHKAVRQMFEEQVGWAVDAGVDFIIGETYSYAQEALIALDVIKRAKQVAVITLAMHQADVTREGWTVGDACKRLADAGADVVGLNCIRGPATMMPLLKQVRAAVKTHVAALPVPYRTSEREPSFQSLRDPHWHGDSGGRPFPVALDPFTCNRFEIAEFGKQALAMDIRYLGVCCGAGPHHIRALAEAVGMHPPGAKYSPDMSKHAFLGSHERIAKVQKDYASKL
ncbi:MAG: homocysteine S-methyltransferase family protein [Betaproteobacteria bacterium]|nr:MAG: homocysteine S-methyltransferase family protein [Betaproteobacteria bacterium]